MSKDVKDEVNSTEPENTATDAAAMENTETPGAHAAEPGEAAEAPAPSTEPEADLSTLLQKVDDLAAEANAHRDRYLRAVADLENYRKRAIREKEEARRSANHRLIEDLLPILDNFSLGLQSARQHEGGEVFAEGFQMILTQMRNMLKEHGIEELHPLEEPFDPNFHEAVGMLPHEEIAEGHIVEVHRVGYKIQDRLLRPAAVMLSSGPAPVEAGSSEA